jgi:Fe-S-cluster containining protein
MEDECLKCEGCGECCKLFLITLTELEYNSKKYKTQFEEFELIKDFNLAEECGANIIMQNSEGGCIYLNEGLCSIHKIRPKACRDFFCTSKDEQFNEMIEKIGAVKEKLPN